MNEPTLHLVQSCWAAWYEETEPESRLQMLPALIASTEDDGLNMWRLRLFGIRHGLSLQPDGTVAADTDYVGTGYVVTSGAQSRAVVVTGDLDSDASVSSADYIVLKKFLTGKVTLTGAFQTASDCDGDNTTNTADYITLAARLKG